MTTSLSLLPAAVRTQEGAEGLVLESATPLPPVSDTIFVWLDRWAETDPDRTFIAQREAGGGWRRASYESVRAAAASVASLLHARGVGPKAPLLLLSDNSIENAIVSLAAMHLGAPVVPVSSAYSLRSESHQRLRQVAEVAAAAAVFAESAQAYAGALASLVALRRPPSMIDAADVRSASTGPAYPRAELTPDTIAKVLFTSGSTGQPKGVVNTQRMLTANQESLRACWPFLEEEPPIVVDWLPWSHTFGSNHNFNLVLRNGGTLYIDEGRPAPGLIETTLRNMAEVGPNLWFNVPRGFDQATAVLERDDDLARAVFRNLRLIFYAAAALAPSTRACLEAVAEKVGNRDVFFTSAWGSTETAPLSTSAHFETETTGVLGVPVPGVQLALVPMGDKRELRVKGPNVTPGYWQPGGEVVPAKLDVAGFLPTGDAGRLVDEAHPERGVVFAGRLSENFKLSSGTWVNVGVVRLGLVDACAPLLADAVLAGHDGDHLGALLVPSPAAAEEPALLAALRKKISKYNAAHPGSSERIRRALVLERPLSLDDGETTDKGYTNQRGVLDNRPDDVARLLTESPESDVLVF